MTSSEAQRRSMAWLPWQKSIALCWGFVPCQEALGSGTYLEEAHHWGQLLLLFLPLCFLFCHEVTSFLLHSPDTVMARESSVHGSHCLKPGSKTTLFLLSRFWWAFCPSHSEFTNAKTKGWQRLHQRVSLAGPLQTTQGLWLGHWKSARGHMSWLHLYPHESQ